MGTSVATPTDSGIQTVEWLAAIFQSGWLTAGALALVAWYFYRELRKSEASRLIELAAQNKLAERVTQVMERLERKAERRD
jgi:hypothetical protein